MDIDEEGSVTLCRICREEIKHGASKCIKCGSFQDWRRYINFSNTVLALLVALASVLSWGIPAIKEALEEDKSEIVFGLQNVSSEGITMLVSNTGTKAGGLTDAVLNIQFNLDEIEIDKKPDLLQAYFEMLRDKRPDPSSISDEVEVIKKPDPLPSPDETEEDKGVKPVIATGVDPLTQLLAQRFENNYAERLNKGSSYLLRASSLDKDSTGGSPFLKPGEVGQYLYRFDVESVEIWFDILRTDINRYLVEKTEKRHETAENKLQYSVEYIFDEEMQNLFNISNCSLRFRAINYNGEESNYLIDGDCESIMPYLGHILGVENPYHRPFREVR